MDKALATGHENRNAEQALGLVCFSFYGFFVT